MPSENIYDWSTTAINNGTADSGISWPEGQTRASVNNSARGMMAAHAKDRNLKNGSIVTTGTANAQAFTSGVGYTTVPTNMLVKLKIGPGLTNTGAATLNMDGIGAVSIKNQRGEDLLPGELFADLYADFLYTGTNWILVNNTANIGATLITKQTVTTSGGVTFSGLVDDYTCYRIIVANLLLDTTNAYASLYFSLDNGSTFLTNYYGQQHIAHISSQGAGSATMSVSGASLTNTHFQVSYPGDVGLTTNLTLDLFGLGSTKHCYVMGRATNFRTTTAVFGDGYAYFDMMGFQGTQACNAARIIASAGNIASGTFSCYGMR
jgi:hypothetical protein